LSTYINKDSVYPSEIGNLYLAKTPYSAINAKTSIILINLKNSTGIICFSKR
jgi:hypothetical protein